MQDDPKSPSVGAPTEYADAEEVPPWFGSLFTALFSLPILLGLCGIIPLILAIFWCIFELFLSTLLF